MVDKTKVLDTIDDLVLDFLYYDRKEDEEVSRGVIETLWINGDITLAEMVDRFSKTLEKRLKLY